MSGWDEPGHVIVGASLAGLRGAEALRRGGYAGPLTIVGDEPCRPYDRPPLSKHVLLGETPPDATGLPQLVPLRARWRLGQAAVALDRAGRTVRLSDGSRLPYAKLLIATGVRARPFPGPGGDLAGVFTLRGRGDAAALRRALAERPRRVLVVGGGLIGCEAASACRDLGLPVTLVDANPTPLARALGTLVGAAVAERMRAKGVDLRAGARVRALEGEGGRVRRAHLTDGAGGTAGAGKADAGMAGAGKAGAVEAEVVIVALGAVRESGWLAAAGLAADPGGLTCDAACRALAADSRPDPDVYAAGDVARWPNPLDGGRLAAVEHWGNAVEQAEHAARNMLAGPSEQRAYAHLPAWWSSQFGVNIKAAGFTEGADAVAIVRGTLAAHRFLAVYGRGGRSVAAVSFDEARWLPAYAERIEAGAPFPPIPGGRDQGRVEIRPPGFPSGFQAGLPASLPAGRDGEREAAHA